MFQDEIQPLPTEGQEDTFPGDSLLRIVHYRIFLALYLSPNTVSGSVPLDELLLGNYWSSLF